MNYRSNHDSKLIFTEVRNQLCGLLLSNDRLTAVRVLPEQKGKIGAVYIAKVKNVVKNIDACFVEIAEGEICFLPLKETAGVLLLNRKSDGRILEGDELPVQIVRDAQKNKQASVTARISLSNDAFAFTLGKVGVGYSSKLSSRDRERLKEFLSAHHLPKSLPCMNCNLSIGMVVRTRAAEYSEEELYKSLEELSSQLVNMWNKASHLVCFSCIMEAPADYETILQQLVYPYEYSEILTDRKLLYEELSAYAAKHFPDIRVRLYEDANYSLSKLYALNTKLNAALERRVWLKSGGYLVIEPTEALTVIDVNSGKYETKKSNLETFYKINLEAAEEIALQLRLRNLSGIIIIDFINMNSDSQRNELLEHLRRLVHRDKQKTSVIDITPLGLVEITRKKEYKPLSEQFQTAEK